MREKTSSINTIDNASDKMSRLYDSYYRALVGYSVQFVEDKDTAKDIVQSIFQKIMERHIDMDNELRVKAYLYNSVRNMSLNNLRRKSAEIQYVKDQTLYYEQYGVNDEGEEEFFTEEIFRLLFKKIDELPSRQREVFVLSMEGKTYKEIGEALRISTETVKTQKQKAIKRLKKELGEMSFLLFY